MKIGFIGAGKASISLSIYFKERGLEITGVYNRTIEKAKQLSNKLGCVFFETEESLVQNTDVIIFAISDDAISEMLLKIEKYDEIKNKVVGHISGALSSDIFNQKFKGQFSLHPIQTLIGSENDVDKLQKSYFTIEGDDEGLKTAEFILNKLGNKYIVIDKKHKSLYHAAACIISNYLIGLLNFSYNIYKQIGFEENDINNIIRTLTEATIGNFLNNRLKALTGPAIRGDITTLKKHIESMNNEQKEHYINLLKLLFPYLLERQETMLVEKLNHFIEELI